MKDRALLVSSLRLLELSDKEAAVYLACLERGSASTLEIARETKIPRSTVYGVVETLIQKDLLTRMNNARELRFSPQDPQRILERTRIAHETMKDVLPDLKGLFASRGNRPKIKYVEGLEQIQSMYWEILKLPRLKQYDIITSTPHFFQLGKSFAHEFMRARAKRNIRTRVIANESVEIRKLQKFVTEYLFEVKVVPDKLFPHLSSFILILPDRVIFVGMKDKIAVAIESNEIREPLQVMFNIIWNAPFEIRS